jgi:hypothetical protein
MSLQGQILGIGAALERADADAVYFRILRCTKQSFSSEKPKISALIPGGVSTEQLLSAQCVRCSCTGFPIFIAMNNVYVSLLLALVLISASRALAKPPIIILPCELTL